MKYKFKKWQKIEVFWEDSSHDSGWTKEDGYIENHIDHSTCGYFLQERERSIQVVQSRGYTEDLKEKLMVDAMMQIPKKAITKIKKLK